MLPGDDRGPRKAGPIRSVFVDASFRKQSGKIEFELRTFLVPGTSKSYCLCRAKPQDHLPGKVVKKAIKIYCDTHFGPGHWLHLPHYVSLDALIQWDPSDESMFDTSLPLIVPAQSVSTSENTGSTQPAGGGESKTTTPAVVDFGHRKDGYLQPPNENADALRNRAGDVGPQAALSHVAGYITNDACFAGRDGGANTPNDKHIDETADLYLRALRHAQQSENVSQKMADFIKKTFDYTWAGLQKLESLSTSAIYTGGRELIRFRESCQTEADLEGIVSILPKVSKKLKRSEWLVDMIAREVRHWGRLHFQSGSRNKHTERARRKNEEWAIFIRKVTNKLAPKWGQACACLLYSAFEAVNYRAAVASKMSERDREICVEILVWMFQSCGRTIKIPEQAWLLHPIFFLSCITKKELSYVCVKIGLENLSTLNIQQDIQELDLETHGIYVGMKFSDLWEKQAEGHTTQMTTLNGVAVLKFANEEDERQQSGVKKRPAAQETLSPKRRKPSCQEEDSSHGGQRSYNHDSRDLPASRAPPPTAASAEITVEQFRARPVVATTVETIGHPEVFSDHLPIGVDSAHGQRYLAPLSTNPTPGQDLRQWTGLNCGAQILDLHYGGSMAVLAAAVDAIEDSTIDRQGHQVYSARSNTDLRSQYAQEDAASWLRNEQQGAMCNYFQPYSEDATGALPYQFDFPVDWETIGSGFAAMGGG